MGQVGQLGDGVEWLRLTHCWSFLVMLLALFRKKVIIWGFGKFGDFGLLWTFYDLLGNVGSLGPLKDLLGTSRMF